MLDEAAGEAVISSEGYARSVLPLVQERVRTLVEIPTYARFFFVEEVDYDTGLLVGKNMNRESTTEALKVVQQRLEALETFDAESLETLLRPLAVELGLKTNQLFHVLRTAVTGRTAAPPLFETMAVLGKERCLNRIGVAVAKLGND
jgi:glutamyl-tRNA synthetase